jgi:hypothetical protein
MEMGREAWDQEGELVSIEIFRSVHNKEHSNESYDDKSGERKVGAVQSMNVKRGIESEYRSRSKES